jgi:transketolase
VGDLQTDQGESLELRFVPLSEFERLRAAPLSPVARAGAFAALARINTLYMIAGAWSGHVGTSFSSIEIMSWLFLNEIRDLDRGPDACDIFFSSKGHDAPALYNVLIGRGLLPADLLHQLRRLHGLPGHPHIETPYIQANTGSLGMGISKAKGMALANRLAGRERRIFVLTGDGELQEGQFWESLGSAAARGLGEIVAIIDHNKIQSDTWVDQVSPLGDLDAKLRAFGWHVSHVDGHDVAALEQTFRALEQVTTQPRVIVADTVKGKGVSFMEGPAALAADELYLFHSGAPSEDRYARGLGELMALANSAFAAAGLGSVRTETRVRNPRREPRTTENLVAAYERALVAQGTRHPQIAVLDADLIKDCGLIAFAKTFPGRFVECGIAEQDMVSMASGMARRGVLPIVHSFACFLAARPNEQIYNQCTESTKVIYVGSLAGLLPGGPGHSHQSVRDISALGAMPDLVLAEPALEAEVGALLDVMVNELRGSAYLRLVSVKWPVPFDYPAAHRVEVGKGWIVRDGSDAVVFGYGPWLLANAFDAAAQIESATGVSIRLVNLPWLNRIDPAWLREVTGRARAVVTLDNHYVRGGQGDMIAAAIAELGLEPVVRVTRVGVTALPECGTNDEVLAHHGLDVAGLVAQLQRATAVAPSHPPTVAPSHPRTVAPSHPCTLMTILFWDIDGTLLTTGKGGVPAWETAVREVIGHDFELSKFRISGLTDYQIAVRTFEQLGVAADEPTVRRMVKRYEDLLPTFLPTKQGHVFPNVREILEQLRARPDIRSYLLTGNTRGGARAKLTHYGLWHYFADGAFAEDAGSRSSIAQRALELARREGPVTEERLFVIGDTEHDVRCADAIGARTVAVLTGGYSREELESLRPWRVVAELPPPADFIRMIDEAQ